MNLKEIKFQWYNNGIKNIKPSGIITLDQFINSIRSPKPEMIEAFKAIEKAAKEGNKQEKDKIKTEKLFFTTPSVIVDPIRNYDSIKSFNGLIVAEYDAVQYAEELRDYIFEKIPSCICAFTSPSKTGTKFIFHTETPKSVQHYKELFFGIAHDLDKFAGLDMSNERCTQPLFNSWDKDIKVRENAPKSTIRGFKINAFVPFEGEIELAENVSEEDKVNCINMITHLIDRIEESGHNQVISSSFLCGGVSAYYGLDLWDLLEDRIRSNEYLSKGTNGYLKSAQTMYNKGLMNPTPLKENDNRR